MAHRSNRNFSGQMFAILQMRERSHSRPQFVPNLRDDKSGLLNESL